MTWSPLLLALGELPTSQTLVVVLIAVAAILILGPSAISFIRSVQSDPPTAEDLAEEERDHPIEQPDADDPLGPLDRSVDGIPHFTDEADTAPDDGPTEPRYDDPSECVKDYHQYATAPNDVDHRFRTIGTDDTERQVMFAEPDDISDFLTPGALQRLFGNPELQYDLSIHVRPLDHEQTKDNAEERRNALKSVQSSIFSDGDSDGDYEETGEEIARLKAYRDAINADQRPADITIVVGARGEDLDELDEEQAEAIKQTLWHDPADIGLETAVGMQDKAIQSLAPIGKDPLGEKDAYTAEVLGLGIGALLGSMNRSTILEEGGIEWGEHADNGSPIIKDPFDSEKNYNFTWIADSGAGKSYNAKRTIAQLAMLRSNTMLIMQDPVQGFKGLAKALGAEEITIGGNRGLNVMEIREPPEHTVGSDSDPGGAKVDEVVGIIKTYANLKEIPFKESQTTAEVAVRQAYEKEAGIDLDDPSTFGKDSPTIADELYDVLEEMQQHPERYTVFGDETGADTIRDHAEHLATNVLRAFKDGSLENLGRESNFDLRDSDVIYLDLSDQDGVGQSSLMMQVIWSQVYERAKETPKDVVLGIDEAEKLMQQASNMQWFEDRVRRARHVNMSTWFITQDINDFFKHDGAEVLLNNSHFRVYHNTSEINRYREELDLTPQQAQFIREANTGDGGYSNALYQFGDRFVPARISALPAAHKVIDYDPQEDDPEDLPGHDRGDSPMAAEIERRLRDGEHQATQIVDGGGAPAPGPWPGAENGLTEDQHAMLDLLSPQEIEELLRSIEEDGGDPDTEVKRAVLAKTNHLRDLLDLDDDPTGEVLEIMDADEAVTNGNHASIEGES